MVQSVKNELTTIYNPQFQGFIIRDDSHEVKKESAKEMTSQSGQTSFMPSSTAFSASDEERHPLKESIATTTFFITYRFNSDKYIEKREVYVPIKAFFQEHFK